MIYNYNQFLFEHLEQINNIENLILSSEDDNLELVEYLLIGQPKLYPLLFGGDIKKLCDMSKLSIKDIFSKNNSKTIKILNRSDFNSLIKFNSIKVEFIPLNIINKLKKVNQPVFLVFENCLINLYGKHYFEDSVWLDFRGNNTIQSGLLSANYVDISNSIKNIIKWVFPKKYLQIKSCNDLIDLKIIKDKKISELCIWMCENLLSLEGLPKIESFQLYNENPNLKLIKFPQTIKKLLLTDLNFENLEVLPKNLTEFNINGLTLNGSNLTKQDFIKYGITKENIHNIM